MKPDDIPEDVWDISLEVSEAVYKAFSFGEARWIVAQSISQARIQAKEEERDLCAMTVHLLTSDDLSDEFYGRPATFGDALDLAESAIRNRSKANQ